MSNFIKWTLTLLILSLGTQPSLYASHAHWKEKARIREESSQFHLRILGKAKKENHGHGDWKFISYTEFKKPFNGYTGMDVSIRVTEENDRADIRNVRVVFQGKAKKKLHIYSQNIIEQRFGEAFVNTLKHLSERMIDTDSVQEVAEMQSVEFRSLNAFLKHMLIREPPGLNAAPKWHTIGKISYKLDYANGVFRFAETYTPSLSDPVSWMRLNVYTKGKKIDQITTVTGCSFYLPECEPKTYTHHIDRLNSKIMAALKFLLAQEEFAEGVMVKVHPTISTEMAYLRKEL